MPLRSVQLSTESPCSSSALCNPMKTLQTNSAAGVDGHSGSGSSWNALKRWDRQWVLEKLALVEKEGRC